MVLMGCCAECDIGDGSVCHVFESDKLSEVWLEGHASFVICQYLIKEEVINIWYVGYENIYICG